MNIDIQDSISYEPESGLFTWNVSRGRVKAGDIAGSTHVNGYQRVFINGTEHLCHRLAFEAVHGEIPAGFVIDHINGNRGDNRANNLRAVPRSINAQNRKKASSHSKTGILGVTFHKGAGRFLAQIKTLKKDMHLGYFDTKEEASAAYIRAKKDLHVGNEAYTQWLASQAQLTILETFIQQRAAA